MPGQVADFRTHPAARRIYEALYRVGDAWRNAVVLSGLARWAAFVFIYAAVITLLEANLGLGYFLRVVSLAFLLLLVFGGGWWFLIRRVVLGFSPGRAARYVAGRMPGGGEEILCAYHLSRRALGSRELVEDFLKGTAASLDEDSLVRAVDRTGLRRSLQLMGLSLMVTVPLLLLWLPEFGTALRKTVVPFGFVPRKTAGIEILDVEPGDGVVISGEDVAVSVTAWVRGGTAPPARLFFRIGSSGDEAARSMQVRQGEGRNRYVYTAAFGAVSALTQYRAEVGSEQSRIYTLTVETFPEAVEIETKITPPVYAGLEPVTRKSANGDIEAFTGSRVWLKARASQPLREASLVFEGVVGEGSVRLPLEVLPAEHETAAGSFHVKFSGRYSLYMVNRWGKSNPRPAEFRVTAKKDQPPRSEIVSPAGDLAAVPGNVISLALRVSDDIGLKSLALVFKRNVEGEPIEAASFPGVKGKREAAETHEWRLPPDLFISGDVVTYYLVAEDAIQSSRSAPRRLHIRNPEQVKAEALDHLKRVREFLQQALKMEEEALLRTEKFHLSVPNLQEASRFLDFIAQGHAGLREDMLSTAALLPREIPALDGPRRFLEAIAANETSRIINSAVAYRDGFAQTDMAGRNRRTEELILWEKALMGRIRAYLGVLGGAIEEVGREEDEGGDLPQNAQEELENLRDRLEEFTEDQKRLIDATSDLAKFASEDLTAEEEKALDDLAQAEDSLKKFLEEAYSDFSRLPSQDFSDPSLLKELNEIISDVELAAGALDRKSVEVAVSLEEAGLELAESLTTHIEKWLPDTVDTTRWSMEEPLTDPETPMAELPTELEDLIGELTQSEDDMSQDNEDVTSAWSDSLDEGAGWGTMDGPISNMSAQGVTGNRLPNESEIGGRSGEGRTGKSSGELVEDTTTGKGGRRTPTRLSPDPYQEGQIDDQSNDPAGGATGGGKMGGAGEEGLEGAPPPSGQSETDIPLAGRTASVRNRAERIALQLEVAGYPNEAIGEVMRNLRSLENDVRNGRYENISQKRHVVLEGLKAAREWVGAVKDARVDFSRFSPAMRDELFDTSAEYLPERYDPVVKAYRKAVLSTGRGAAEE